MDVVGQWFLAGMFGGSFKLVQGEEEADAERKSVTFLEGVSKIHLHCGIDGWWEGPPESGLRLCRRGPHLVLLRRRGKGASFRQSRAATSPLTAACLWYKSLMQSIFLITKDPPTPAPPPTPLPPAKETQLEPTSQSATPAQNLQNLDSELRPEDSELWPEPEADCQPEQPSTAQDQNSVTLQTLMFSEAACDVGEHLPEAISDEWNHPQVLSMPLGVTSLGHDRSIVASVVPLGVQAEDLSAPTTSERTLMDTPKAVLGESLDRVVVEVADLRSTIHGLLSVPEDAELPDVPNPMAPSKSDSAILHGSVAFDGDSDAWLQLKYGVIDGDEKANRDAPAVHHGRIALGGDMGSAENVTIGCQHEQAGAMDPPRQNPLVRSTKASRPDSAVDTEQAESDAEPRPRQNPLVRSSKVSGNVTMV